MPTSNSQRPGSSTFSGSSRKVRAVAIGSPSMQGAGGLGGPQGPLDLERGQGLASSRESTALLVVADQEEDLALAERRGAGPVAEDGVGEVAGGPEVQRLVGLADLAVQVEQRRLDQGRVVAPLEGLLQLLDRQADGARAAGPSPAFWIGPAWVSIPMLVIRVWTSVTWRSLVELVASSWAIAWGAELRRVGQVDRRRRAGRGPGRCSPGP